jgi:hypothetical protein
MSTPTPPPCRCGKIILECILGLAISGAWFLLPDNLVLQVVIIGMLFKLAGDFVDAVT